MRILLVGNYPYLKSQSMDRFASLLEIELSLSGNQVRLLKPTPFFGCIMPSATGLGKWLSYLDRFVLFRRALKRSADWADVVHICDQANAVYVPWIKQKPHVVTCHDMLAIRNALGEISEHSTGSTGRVYQRWILSGLKQAQHVVCVSKATCDDLLRLTGLDASRASVVHNGLNYPYRRMSHEESHFPLNQIGVANIGPFFVHVGNNNWYKNRDGLLRIFSQVVELSEGKDWHLILTGAKLLDRSRALVEKLGIGKRVVEIPGVTNEQLCSLYSTAEGLIFPSLAEGFGWPIIEAQACGCQVFASNRRPMTEVGGDGAVYFDPLNEAAAAQIILKALGDMDLMRKRGYRNAAKHSTKGMISGYIHTYDVTAG